MVTFDAWRFPDGETHLPKRMMKGPTRVEGRLTYQYPLYARGRDLCAGRAVAVDVGAHVGLFSYWMVQDFGQVVAFEPVASHRDCWAMNVPARAHDQLIACALGSRAGSVAVEPVVSSSTGGSRITGPGAIPLRTLDSFELPQIDLLKIDCEGFEVDVLRGASETIERCRPVVIVEQRAKQVAAAQRGPIDAVTCLQRQGARVIWSDRCDYVLTWGPR